MHYAAGYNQRRHARGLFTTDQISRVAKESGLELGPLGGPRGLAWDAITQHVVVWQSLVSLTDDGMFGPASLKRYHRLYDAPTITRFADLRVDVALEYLGRGEEGGDNAGEFVHMLRNFPYSSEYDRPVGNWCEFFVNYVDRQTAERMQIGLPYAALFPDSLRGGKLMPIGSAKKYTDRQCAAWREVPITEAQRGDTACRTRGRLDSAYGHIMIVEKRIGDKLHVIEGNAGNDGPGGLSIVRQHAYSIDGVQASRNPWYRCARPI